MRGTGSRPQRKSDRWQSTILESGDHLGVAGERRKDPQLELGIVGIDEDAALGSTEKITKFRIGRDVLQIWVGAGVTPGNRPTGMQLTMQPPAALLYPDGQGKADEAADPRGEIARTPGGRGCKRGVSESVSPGAPWAKVQARVPATRSLRSLCYQTALRSPNRLGSLK
jgi:hypothetical protein